MNIAVVEAPPVEAPPQVAPDVPPAHETETDEPRPYFDPDEVREPKRLCPQQKREEVWEVM